MDPAALVLCIQAASAAQDKRRVQCSDVMGLLPLP